MYPQALVTTIQAFLIIHHALIRLHALSNLTTVQLCSKMEVRSGVLLGFIVVQFLVMSAISWHNAGESQMQHIRKTACWGDRTQLFALEPREERLVVPLALFEDELLESTEALQLELSNTPGDKQFLEPTL